MATPEKAAAIVELTEKFRSSGAAVLTEYRGLRVTEITELRNSMREHATYAVVKNTLTKRAAAEAGIEGLDEHLVGPTAIAFITGDPVEAAKGLRDFAKANPALVIKAGVLDGKPLSPEEITKLADLESREVLLAKLAGAMKGNLSKAVGLFAAPLSTTARVVDQLRAMVEEQGGPVSGTTQDSAPESTESTEEAAPAAAEETPVEAAAEATTDVAEGGDES